MEQIKKRIFNSPTFQKFILPNAPGQVLQINGLSGSLRSIFLSFLFEIHKKNILYITHDEDRAERVRDDLELITGKEQVSFFPVAEMTPYSERGGNPSLIRLRLETLQYLLEHERSIIVATAKALTQKVVSAETFVQHQLFLKTGNTQAFQELFKELVSAGYERCDTVEDVGHFAVRGGIIDIYPWTSDDPVRIEFFGDRIESIRTFNVISQRSINEVETIEILPVLSEAPRTDSLLDYLNSETILILEDQEIIREEIRNEWIEIEATYQRLVNENIHPQAPGKYYLKWDDIIKYTKRFIQIRIDFVRDLDLPSLHVSSSAPPTFAGHLNRLFGYLKKTARDKNAVYIQCDSGAQADRITEILEEEGLDGLATISSGALHNGFIYPESDLQILTDHEIFDRFKRRRTYKRFKNGEYLRSLNALNLYDYIVHIDYGVGQYMGLETLDSGSSKKECIKLVYADNDTLYVTIDRLNRVQKYASEDEAQPKLTKLGTEEWDRVKKRTKDSIQKIAAELIQLNAARKIEKGFAVSDDTHWQKELEASFPFEETEDQLRSIVEVKKDLETAMPMDRLLCGDVGYGKTEVALRAAFKVVMSGKQVAILVPTTILAYQHFQTFKERMSEFPLHVEMLSRFRSVKEQRTVISKLALGEIDIIIGTHRLLSDDIQFKDLGLLIIDEEQRFGVRHKDKLKKLRVAVDVLTMSATPIPRTLHLSLMGARDLSHIETPPRNRLPVITEIHEWDDDLLARVIRRELERKGQVYFVHNRVQTIDGICRIVKEIVPEARIAIAHGQLPEKELEQIMLDFIHKKYDILISTMIIENGLDIPNVNTIIIDRADKFGLAQLYQLRGRVGRAGEQAYAYLLIPHISKLNNLAQKRLRAIQDFTDLGSGLKVSLRDMEIRGIGNILGKEQSGNIQAVGFQLYCKILDDAVNEIKTKSDGQIISAVEEGGTDPKIDVDFDLMIPQGYIFSEHERISIYHRLVNCRNLSELENMRDELKDRFGALPQEVINLIAAIEVKILSTKIYASRIILKDGQMKIQFSPKAKDDQHFYENVLPNLLNHKKLPVQFIGNANELAVQIKLGDRPRGDQFDMAKNLLKSVV
jgi:transcription-repair coupling factor (superfamily II helicase)